MERSALSVVIPVYNRAGTVRQAVESALEQDYVGPYEVVVIDDGSTDSTPSLLAAYGQRIRIIRQQNLGRSAARNAGVRHSVADLIAFLDSDDYWLSGKIAAVIKSFEERPDVGLTYSDYCEVDSADGRYLGIVSLPENPSLEQMFHRLICVGVPSSVAVRRAVFEQAGGFDERLHWGEDIDFYLRLRQVCSFYRIPGPPLIVYRKRTKVEDSVRAYSPQTHAILERVMREHFGRRANGLINQMRNQRAAALLTLALTQLNRREWRRALSSLVELATYRPIYAPRVALERLLNRRRRMTTSY
jgi:glycosyltransferase involved in cell wall biosynthesis